MAARSASCQVGVDDPGATLQHAQDVGDVSVPVALQLQLGLDVVRASPEARTLQEAECQHAIPFWNGQNSCVPELVHGAEGHVQEEPLPEEALLEGGIHCGGHEHTAPILTSLAGFGAQPKRAVLGAPGRSHVQLLPPRWLEPSPQRTEHDPSQDAGLQHLPEPLTSQLQPHFGFQGVILHEHLPGQLKIGCLLGGELVAELRSVGRGVLQEEHAAIAHLHVHVALQRLENIRQVGADVGCVGICRMVKRKQPSLGVILCGAANTNAARRQPRGQQSP